MTETLELAAAPTAQAAPLIESTAEVLNFVAVPVPPKKAKDSIYNNCWLYMQSKHPSLPSMKTLQAMARASKGPSHNGDIIVFDYPHFGEQVNSKDGWILIDHSNWQGDSIKQTWFRTDDRHIIGHVTPSDM